MRPLVLTLTGFKGIRSGLGLHTVTFDFRKYKGLVAIVGDNGRGKSTIKGNMHPYRLMPDRVKKYSPKAFSFYDECYGSDARKELVFAIDGVEYKSVLLIDADRRKQEAYLYRLGENGQWPIYGDTQDGKLDVYDTAIEELVGSPRMFFTSIFRSQKAPALSSYTRSEMMDIFSELISVDEHKEKKENAGAVADALLLRRGALAAERQSLELVVKDAGKKAEEKATAERRLSAIGREIEALDYCLKATEGTLKDLQIRASLQNEAVKQKERIEADASAKEKEIEELGKSLKEKRDYYNGKYKDKKSRHIAAHELIKKAPELRKKAAEEVTLNAEAAELKVRVREIDERLTALSGRLKEFSATETRIKEAEKSLERAQLGRKHVKESAEKDLCRARESAKKLQDVPCADSGVSKVCKFVKDAAADRDSLSGLEEALAKVSASDPQEKILSEQIEALKASISGKAAVEKEEKDAKVQKDTFSRKLEKLEGDLSALREELKMLSGVEEAEKSIPLLERELADILREGKETMAEIEKRLVQSRSEVETLRTELKKLLIDASFIGEIGCLQELGEEERGAILSLRKEDAELRVLIGSLAEALKQIETAKASILRLFSEIEDLDRDISEWHLLEKAMEGIITLEIDDAGPTVTAITNDILHSCYGPRFSGIIKTQDEKVKGDDMKEVFDIIVFDSERDESKSLSVMSGGEETWIDDAITRGISLFNASRGGKRYHALFSDEKDGRLTEKKRKEFMAVKRKVLELGGFDCEYFISHTKEIQEMADAIIDLDEFVVGNEAEDSERLKTGQETLV